MTRSRLSDGLIWLSRARKRLREVLLGVVSLLSWQWMEGRQIHKEWRARS